MKNGPLVAVALIAALGGHWLGGEIFSPKTSAPPTRSLGTDDAISRALNAMDAYDGLLALVHKLEGVDADMVTHLPKPDQPPSSAASPAITNLGALPYYLHSKRANARAVDILNASSLNESPDPASPSLARDVENCLAVFRWRIRKLIAFRNQVLKNDGAILVASNSLSEAKVIDEPEAKEFIRSYAAQRPGQSILHLRPELYVGGSNMIDWLMQDGKLFLVSYDDIPQLEVIDNYLIYTEKRCSNEIACILRASGRIRESSFNKAIAAIAATHYSSTR